ncbi:hypothetical protein METHPM2_1310012 [Pseudomonas sp. PM2]
MGELRKSRRRRSNCRSELAREKLKGTACIQDARVIVNDFREQARSYSDGCKARKRAVIL